MDAQRTVVIDEEARGGGTGGDALLLEEAVELPVGAFQPQVGSGQLGIDVLAAAGQVAQSGQVSEGVDVGVGDASVLVQGVASGDAEAPVAQVGVVGHGQQGQLEAFAGLLREVEVGVSDSLAVVSDRGEGAGRVGRIEAAVVEGRAVDLDAADGSGREVQTAREPDRETFHGAVLLGLGGQHQGADELRHQQRVPRVEQLVAAVDVGFARLGEAAPIGQHADVLVGLAALGYFVAHEPHGVVDLAHVVAVVVVGAVSVSEGESLVDGVVHDQEEVVVVFRVAVDVAVQGEGVEHVLDVVEPQFALRTVALVVREQRGADDAAVVGAADLGRLEGLQRPRDDRAVDVVSARHVGLDDGVDAGFHQIELFFLVGGEFTQRFVVFVLFPLPEPGPVPEGAFEVAVVVGDLLVGGDLVVEAGFGEGQAVDIEFAALHALRGGDRQARDLLRGVVAGHVVVLDPAGAPPREVEVEVEIVGDFARGGFEGEVQVGVDSPGVVDPEHDARLFDAERADELSEVVVLEGRRCVPGPAQGLPSVLEVFPAQFDPAVVAAYESFGDFRFEGDFGIDCGLYGLLPEGRKQP